MSGFHDGTLAAGSWRFRKQPKGETQKLKDAILGTALVVGILVASALVTSWFTRVMYVRCDSCGTLNAKRRVRCRACQTDLR